jgi:hypothetical protein
VGSCLRSGRGLGDGDRGLGDGDRGLGDGDRGLGDGDRGLGDGDRGLGDGDRGLGDGDRGIGDGDRGPKRSRLGAQRACRAQVVETRADGRWKRPGRLGLPGPSRLFADRGLGGRNGYRCRKRAEGLSEDVRIGPDLPIVARLVSRRGAASRREAALVLPPGFETVVAAGFVGLRHDAHEIVRQLDPCNSGRASTNRSDRSTNVER